MNSSNNFRVARCTVGRDKYFIDLGGVASIQQSNVVTQLPTAHQPVGRLDTAQGPIPVYSLSNLLSDDFQSLTVRAYCLIIHRNGQRWGLMVDQIQQSTELTHDQLLPLPHDLHANWCLGAALTNASDTNANSGAAQLLLVINPAAIDGQSPLAFGTRSYVRQNVGRLSNTPRSGERGYEAAPLTSFELSQPSTAVRQLVLFELATNNSFTERTWLALNAAQVQEITGPQAIARLPHAPTGVLGLIAWRGQAVPLLNLSATLGLPDHVGTRLTRVVIARRPFSEDYIAFIAPSAIRTQLLGKNQTTRRDDLNIDESRFFGAFATSKEILLVPNLDAIFTNHFSPSSTAI